MPDRPRTSTQETGARASKVCSTCGRTVTWRKSLERNWDEVKYCSDACRTHKPGAQDYALEQAIVGLLSARGRDKSICPSEAARVVAADNWQALMQPARSAARRLVAAGKIVITQGGTIVDGSTAKGPIRLRLR